MQNEHIVIQDQVGRTIIGLIKDQTDTQITLSNPVYFYCQHHENTGQIEVKTFPMFFFEFLNKDFKDQNDWTFNKASIVIGNVVLDDTIMQKYAAINTPATAPVVSTDASPKVISINDL